MNRVSTGGIGERHGGKVSTGMAVGGGIMALGAICVGCLAPALSVIGPGIVGSLFADVPSASWQLRGPCSRRPDP